MERIILISDRATKEELSSVDVLIDPAKFVAPDESIKDLLIRLVKTTMRMKPDVIVVDTDDESILALPLKYGIHTENLYSFREKRLWKVASQVLDGASIWQCYKRRYVNDIDCAGDRIYDSEIFKNRKEASARCRELNAPLLPPTDGWMNDGHPQSW